MKKYLISEVPQEVWIALEGVFRSHHIDCLPLEWACDGIDVQDVEITKKGIIITCTMCFLPTCESFKTIIQLNRPHFSSINDFIEQKLEMACIDHSELEGSNLWVEIKV